MKYTVTSCLLNMSVGFWLSLFIIISDDCKLTKNFDTFFKNVVGNLNIRDIMNNMELNSTSPNLKKKKCVTEKLVAI